ncbi:MAG TPA: tol-pal system protein YbgF [Rhodanobacteraceae bacterium]|nr:tol-pal system protein YbgF [Rhodanobacteraceae bacterium]
MKLRGLHCGIKAAVAFAAAAVVMGANAQTLSLGERVTRLEQQQAQQRSQPQSQGGVALVNQVQDLQAQIQQMEGRIEELQHQVQQLQEQNKQQYVDLDSRLGKLEGGNTVNAPAPAVSSAAATPAPAPAATAAPPQPAAPSGPLPPPTADQQAAYNAAFKAVLARDYVAASRGFRAYIQQYPDSALAPNAYYWLGESYYATANYQVSLQTFQALLANYPASDKAPDALLKIGYAQAEMKQYDDAKATLIAVMNKYPDTTVARLAKSRIRAITLQQNGG